MNARAEDAHGHTLTLLTRRTRCVCSANVSTGDFPLLLDPVVYRHKLTISVEPCIYGRNKISGRQIRVLPLGHGHVLTRIPDSRCEFALAQPRRLSPTFDFARKFIGHLRALTIVVGHRYPFDVPLLHDSILVESPHRQVSFNSFATFLAMRFHRCSGTDSPPNRSRGEQQ
ncbi:hypothetical protein GCM10011588_27110 [Nocardia jinanensis]|uniref:Uncharacterized protein n=1 Tax=Nocardia jinanensis TaxID=382504 RepID=A0A917VT01_9NOCA|nr:hypothetical protein GCM10011588_27110 [Nocardia jinanensis]